MEGFPPERTLPSSESLTMSSGFRNPLFTPEGVMRTSLSLILTLMLPPADTVIFLSYSSLQISARRSRAYISFIVSPC